MPVSIVTIVLLVLGLTEWIKTKLKLVDTAAEVASFIIGFLFGGAYQYVTSAPVDLNGWFTVLVVATGMALVPSGLYKFGSNFVAKFAVAYAAAMARIK